MEVDRINTLFKFAYIRDMDLLFLEVWRNEYGFALVELAMVRVTLETIFGA